MMKTKKILAILISCLLLIGVAVGFTASAADETTVNIVAANVSYDGATRILYTVDAQNLASGSKVQIVFSSDENVAAPSGKLDAAAYDFVSASFGNVTVGGKTYKAVYSDGFEPVEINKKVYAIPVVTDADDNVVATGNKVGFSVYDYLMTRLAGEYTPEQYLLYVATLDFSGSVQYAEKVTEGKDPAYGYVDAYYGLKIVNADGSVTTQSFREPTSYAIKAPKGYNGKLFEKFTDENGVAYEEANFNQLTVNVDKLGYTTVKMVYGDTEISMDGITATAGNDATLTNNDSITVNGGSEFYIEGDVTLAAGTSATLAFNPDVATVTLTESNGAVTVSDGVSSFEMANGATLRVEYTVLSTTNLTGVIFYYVDGEFVAKSDVTSTANTSFTGVTASATAGEITIEYAVVGAENSSIMGVKNNATNTTATFELDANGNKYLVVSKSAQNLAVGSIEFTYGGERKAHAVFETKMKLTGGLYDSQWRNYIDFNLQVLPGQYNVVNPRIIVQKTSVKVNGVAATLETPIADDGWFDLKLDVVSGSALNVYVNGQLVGTVSISNSNKLGYISIIPSADAGTSSISIMDSKFYTLDE